MDTAQSRESVRGYSRRSLLAGAAAIGSGAASGCLDFAAGDGPQGPDGSEERLETLECDEESFRRLEQPFGDQFVGDRSVETPEGRTFELSIEGDAVSYGSGLRLVLTNTDDESGTTFGEHAISIQRDTQDGWLDVRGHPDGDGVNVPIEETETDPGQGYSWDIPLTEAGIADTIPDANIDVCPALGPGRYRFVYWGLPRTTPVAAEFDLVG